MEESNIRSRLHKFLLEHESFLKVKDNFTEDELKIFISKAIDELCKAHNLPVTEMEKASVLRELVGSIVSLGPLRPLVEDQDVSEIMVNGPNQIYVQKKGHLELTNIKFEDSRHLLHVIQKILVASGSSRRVDESSPYVDFSLSDGSRVNVILPPCSTIGPVVTIRKFSTSILTIDDLLKRSTLNKKMALLLIAAIKAKLNIIFCGATGTGKTTALNILSRHIPKSERIVTIEDTAELRLLQEHVVGLQSKQSNIEGKGAISIRELFINSLRMRPDRIIIGEVRGEEALDLIQAIASGHSGSLAIIHADSPQDCFNRLVTMLLMSGIRLSTEEIKRQVTHAIDMIVHIELFMDGNRRITNITDLSYDNQKSMPLLEDVFYFEQKRITEEGAVIGDWVMNPKKPSFYTKFIKRNAELPGGFFDA